MSIMGGKLEIWRGNVKIDAGRPIEVRFTAWESAFHAVGRTSIRERMAYVKIDGEASPWVSAGQVGLLVPCERDIGAKR